MEVTSGVLVASIHPSIHYFGRETKNKLNNSFLKCIPDDSMHMQYRHMNLFVVHAEN